jgi:signal transduction histidine kinase
VGPVVLTDASPARVTAAGVVLVVAQGAVLWWRRRAPLAVLAAVLVVVLVTQALGDENAAAMLGPYAAAYAVAAFGTSRAAWAGVGALAAAAVADAVVVRLVDAPQAPVLGWPGSVLLALAWVGGRYVAVRRAYLEALVAHARRLEADREERARQAVSEERRRIARELHDQIAHHLGVVSLQAGAARRWLDRDPERVRSALDAAESASRTALQTMPVILQALRTDDGAEPGPAPQPALADLDALLDGVRASGLPVEVEVLGDRRELHPAVELAAYRIVQEALTNALKHAGPATATVRLRYAPDRLEVEVVDDGRGAAAAAAGGASGFGLVGMAERVDLLGGVLDAGPRAGGGFGVRAVLPARGV